MQQLTENGYEIWFTPPPETIVGIVLQQGIVKVYLKDNDNELHLITTLPPVAITPAIDDFTRNDVITEGVDPWTIERDEELRDH